MTIIRIMAVLAGLIAVFMTFRAEFIITKILKKEPTERMVLRVKYTALIIAVIIFLTIFILER
ncbi:MAG: hypothetical protein J1F01_08055 [Oscillospiraceae bacterium]|nr:hypothetical protein [Oscillospiraceae bacterium]